MAAPQRLEAGSIDVSAQPVNTFLQFDANSQPAAPTRPSMLPQVSQVTAIQRGQQRSVQGVNRLEELTEALKPLSKLYDAGMEMYASDQYQRGQNEILRAAANVNRDTIIKSYNYAEDNRQVSSQNPVAGVLMDQANPFRRAGQINQASRWAASLVPDLMRAQWLKHGADLSKVDPSSPAVAAIEAQVTNGIAQSFGLDEFSPGFQQYVVPQINRSYEWFANQQLEANVKYQKDVGVSQTAEILNSILRKGALGSGVDRKEWMQTLDEAAARFGITGEPQAMTKKAILQSLNYWTSIAYNPGFKPAVRQVAADMITTINKLPSGLVDEKGEPIAIGIAYAGQSLKAQASVASDARSLSDAQEELNLEQAEAFLEEQPVTNLMPGSPELADLEAKLMKDFNISRFEARELIKKGIQSTDEFTQSLFNPNQLNGFFTDADGLVGSAWNEGVQRKRFLELIVNATGANLTDANRRWNELKARKRAEQAASIDFGRLDGNIDNAAKAAVLKLFPGQKGVLWIETARSRGQTILEYLSSVEADEAAGLQQITNSLQQSIIGRIMQETADTGGILSPTRQGQIAQEEIDNLMKNEAKLRQLSGIPEPKPQVTTPEPEPVKPPQVYLPGATVPEAAAKGNQPVYSKEDTQGLFFLAAASKPVPMGVRRAARAAGMTPGQFILKQFDLHGLTTTNEVREKILRNSNRSMGAEDALFAAKPGNTPVARSSGVLLDILLGTAPSYS